MLSADLTFNLNSIKSYSFYSCELPDGCIEQELSFCVPLGPGTERRGDVFPFYRVPENKVIELTDWSFNTGGPENNCVGSRGQRTCTVRSDPMQSRYASLSSSS
jgi:hypothetical protein